jgi:hypothetical protein
MSKRLELLSELVPQATVIALLVNPTNSTTERITSDVQEAARAKGVQYRQSRCQLLRVASAHSYFHHGAEEDRAVRPEEQCSDLSPASSAERPT